MTQQPVTVTQEDREAVEIAGKLTKAQRAFVLSLPIDGTAKHWPEGMHPHEREGLRSFGQSGLIASRYGHSGVSHSLTPVGQDVAHLLQQERSA